MSHPTSTSSEAASASGAGAAASPAESTASLAISTASSSAASTAPSLLAFTAPSLLASTHQRIGTALAAAATHRSAAEVVALDPLSRDFPKPAHEPGLDELLARPPAKYVHQK